MVRDRLERRGAFRSKRTGPEMVTRAGHVMTNIGMQGVVAAIPTPIDGSGQPDLPKLEALARHLLKEGCDGLNILGTTGEATSFSIEQRFAVMAFAASSDLPLDRLMVGTGAAAVDDATALTRKAAELGYAAALVLPPFYYKGIPEGGIVDYFRPIVAASHQLPLYLYNFPAMTGVAYSPELVGLLRDTFGDRIAGLKDSSGDVVYARRIALQHPGMRVFPSNEATLLEARSGIFAGCISATANLNSAFCAAAWRDGDAEAQSSAVSIRKLFDGKMLVPSIKGLLAKIHGDPVLAAVKPPMRAIDEETANAFFADYRAIAA